MIRKYPRIEFLRLLIITTMLFLFSACSDQRVESSRNKNKEVEIVQIRKDDTESKIRALEEEIIKLPYDYSSLTSLGEAYIQRARETGDAEYNDKAELALKKAIELNKDNYLAYVLLGRVCSYRHEFRETLDYAIKAINIKPEQSIAFGILGDAYMELGEYDKAGKAYEFMQSLRPGFDSYSRISYIKELTGDAESAIQLMQMAIEDGLRRNLPRENIAWAHVILGSLYFNKGDLNQAEKYYREALNISTDYYLALEHIAEINARKGNYEEAVKLYKKVISLNPKGEFYKALADSMMKLGRQEEAEQFYDKTTEIYDDYVRKGNNGYLRQIALFYSDNDTNIDKALELASKDLEIKPDIYAYDTLAWVYYKRGDLDKAMEAAQKSMVLGTKDSTLYYHIGMIHHRLGNRDKAKEYLTLALSTNPYFDTDAVEEIRLALGEQDKSG